MLRRILGWVFGIQKASVLPVELVLVRHGESEGNLAVNASEQGDNSYYTTEFKSRHSQSWSLTNVGINQAIQCGKWIRENLDTNFARHYVSEYRRALHTAGYLALPNASWSPKMYLRERDWGMLDSLTKDEYANLYREYQKQAEKSSFLWRPPSGESIPDVIQRIKEFLDTLVREVKGLRSIVVCHGEVMWAFRQILESVTMEDFERRFHSDAPEDKIHNCQILIYTRKIDPYREDSALAEVYTHVKSVNPMDVENSINRWKKITPTRYTNEQLLAI